ncbi:MAG TPA: CoB--CoM heterodisulfide reductase iron-sulfur subunit A family protein [candidate division Zixibacteria bacterium]|nr:CoB--CoM heterodisulfide reductase iron-sulfur subunit A family protein [candidate division Zixibacteria bacterium]
MTDRRIGAFICGCGGNISDYVDIEKVRDEVEKEPGVVVARTAMFTCSDATQREIIDIIREQELDGIVVASCSPKLHLNTFRAMARRAGLNQYVYNQVNIREQCSWTHTHDMEHATDKAIRLIRAGIARTLMGHPLEMIRVKTIPRVLIIGAGISGLQAARLLSTMGIEVHLVESAPEVGGQVASWGPLFPSGRSGKELVQTLTSMIEKDDRIHIHTSSQVVEKTGNVGEFDISIQSSDGKRTSIKAGAIIVATGFQRYKPPQGEFGYGLPGVLTLDEFRDVLDNSDSGSIRYNGRDIKNISYIYCVGSRQGSNDEGSHSYCSRYCCTAAVHTALLAGEKQNPLHQYHLFRDMRTYGKQELLYEEALQKGSLFLKFPDEEPPSVKASNGHLEVALKDQLTGGEEINIGSDLVVLVTGMEARPNRELIDVLKLPVGKDGFFNEIHCKLRPVETVMDGILIAGSAQGPKNVHESTISSMAAVAKSAGLLMKGYVDLEPFVAVVDPDLCEWCDDCSNACPYDAIGKIEKGGKAIAQVTTAICKGCGTCVPACEKLAINVEGYTHKQITNMIDALAKEVV